MRKYFSIYLIKMMKNEDNKSKCFNFCIINKKKIIHNVKVFLA